MKYIKKFENNQFKKYIIFYYDHFLSLEILEVNSVQKDMIITSELYSYKDNKLTKEKGHDFAVMNDSYDQILYQSDSLEECIDIIPSIYNSNKYNL